MFLVALRTLKAARIKIPSVLNASPHSLAVVMVYSHSGGGVPWERTHVTVSTIVATAAISDTMNSRAQSNHASLRDLAGLGLLVDSVR